MSNPDIRVEKGHAEPEEVAALTAILLARAAAHTSTAARAHGGGRAKAGWRRLEREPGFRAPHSWHG
ncbi:acyl-CoA carboxylase subunit epsilon [Streptomyces sp. NPDC002309]